MESIKAKSLPKDIAEHAVLGTTYRVRVLSTGVQGVEGSKRSSIAIADRGAPSSSRMPPSPKRPELADSPQRSELADNVQGAVPSSESKSSSHSSSSSSSSSSSDKKRKKAKKSRRSKKHNTSSKKSKASRKGKIIETATQKRAREMLAREAQKEQARQCAARKKLAEQIINKVSATKLSLETHMAKPLACQVPDPIKIPASDTLAKLIELDGQARNVIEQEGNAELPVGVGCIKDITSLIESGKKSSALLSTVLCTLSQVQA